MMYSQDLIEAVLKAADIVTVISSYLNVEKHGRSYLAVCPFHDDKNPSLNISKEKQIFKCFSCGTGGNSITFVQQYEKCSFAEAVRKTADIVGFQDPRLKEDAPRIVVDESKKKLYECINDLNTYYRVGLSIPEAANAREYLKSRNIDETQQKKYGIGYSPMDGKLTVKFLQAKGHSLKSIEDIGIAFARIEGSSDSNAGRITFPIYDPYGQVVGFSARRLDGIHDKKYVNSPETPIFHKGSILYNYHNIAQSARHDGYCYVLEGFMDVMALERAGLPNAVALMGTALTQEQVNLLKKLRCELRLCLDGDEAGQTGMMRMCALLSKNNVSFRFVDYGKDLRDPDDILQQEGPEALKKRMESLIDPIDFQLAYYLNTKKLDNPEDRRKVLSFFLPYVRSLPSGIEQENYIAKLSRATGYESEAIRALLAKARPGEETEEEAVYREAEISASSLHPERALLKKLMLAERTILYYMLHEKDAIDFFKINVKDFVTEVYEAIAMYIVDFSNKHPGEIIDVASIIAAMQSSQSEDEEPTGYYDALANLSLETNHEPFSQDILEACLKTIVAEKKTIHEKKTTEESMRATDDPREKAKWIDEYINNRMRPAYEKSKKKGR